MRIRVGGRIGPVRAGVSVGRRGVGWGAGVGPVSVTGGRSRTRRSGGSSSASGGEWASSGDVAPLDPRMVSAGCGAMVAAAALVAGVSIVGSVWLGVALALAFWTLFAALSWSERKSAVDRKSTRLNSSH